MVKVLGAGALLIILVSTLGCASHNQKAPPPPEAITDCHAKYTFFLRQCKWLENGQIVCNGVVVTPRCLNVKEEKK